MKIPVVVQERLNCPPSELLFRQCLGDLYRQFLVMDQNSKGGHEGDAPAPQASIWWHCDSSHNSASSTEFVPGEEVMFSVSDLQSSFSGKSTPIVRSAESLVLSEGEFGADLFRDALPKQGPVQIGKHEVPSLACFSEEFRSAEVNPVTYENFTVSSRACRADFMTESSSTSLSTAMGQYNDLSLASSPKAFAETGARVSDDGEGVSDDESVSFAVRESDCKWRGVTGGMNTVRGHRFCQPLEDLLCPRVKLMCSFSGRIVPRPYDGKLRYVGGETRIIAVNRNICYAELMYKLTESYGVALTLKYQLPDEDLDALVSVSSDDDLQNMMEEHDRLEAGGGSSRLRLFLFFAAEYDSHHVQNADGVDDDGDCRNSDQEYVDAINGFPDKSFAKPIEGVLDAINGFPDKSFAKPIEGGLTGAVHQVEECVGSDNISITRSGYAAEAIRTTQGCISGMVHQQPAALPVSSIQTFPRPPPSTPSSAPSSPPMPSRETYVWQQPVAADISLQFFQDRLNNVSVHRHCPISLETCFQDLDQVGCGRFSSRQREHYFPFSDSQRGPCSPRPLGSEVVLGRGEPFRTGDTAGGLGKSTNVFEQHLEYGTITGNGPIDPRSDTQQLHEVHVPQVGLQRLVFLQQQHQHQHRLIPQQQHSAWQSPGDPHWSPERVETVQHCIHDASYQPQALQQPSLHAPYLHSHHTTAGHNGISRQGEQQLVHQEDHLRDTFLQRSVSSHAMGMGAQPSYGLPSAAAYHPAAIPSSPTIVIDDIQAQHHLQMKRDFGASRNDQPHGRRVHYDTQASRNFQMSVSPPGFRRNMVCSDEWAVRQQQQHHHPPPLAGSVAGFQELVGNSSQHLCGNFPPSQCRFFDSLASPPSPQYTDICPAVLDQTKIRCQTACLERDTETSILKPFTPHLLNSWVDYHQQRSQVSEKAPIYLAYRESHDKSGDRIGAHINFDMEDTAMLCSGGDSSRQLPYSGQDLGRVLEGGECFERGYSCYCNCATEGFDSPALLAAGGIGTVSYPRTELLESSGTVPATMYASSGALHAVSNISRGSIREELQVSSSPMSLRLSEPVQLPGAAMPTPAADSERTSLAVPGMQPYLPLVTTSQALPGVYMLAEQKSSGLTFPKADSRLSTPVTDAKNVSSDFGGATDSVNLLNGAHELEEPSACDEMYMGNIQGRENHIADGGVGWITTADNNALGEKAPDFPSGSLLAFDYVQPKCENAFLEEKLHFKLGQEKLFDVSGGSSFPTSIPPAASCPSTHMVSAPYPWHAFHPTALNIGQQDEASSTFNLPIYDRSPMGSVSATASRDFFLDPDEIGTSHAPLDSDKGTSVGRMSLTGRLAEDMICSVLESCGKTANYEAKPSSKEVVHDSSDGHERNGRKEEDLKSTTKHTDNNVSPPSTVQESQNSVLVEHFLRENMNSGEDLNVEEASEAVAEEKGASKESKHETLEQIGDDDSDGTGKKGMNHCSAEVEAISRGLQTIKNADLEEIRELGSGTFGTVYHGKWRGSDVAIKRIKASCFTGPPSEQERLISDFWREACTLGQLHHPNVVAFYGVVPDGPDGTLATVTEYMVNGSLKQVLHKKDRTIDRRKRLLIAMDAAFGMEYLHSKNIVHFDLKCENLLVNMRDPHRPICKVGDFGLSKVKHQTLVSGGVRGTLPWMAPELLSGNNSMVTEKIDVFSFGIAMWELLTGEEPYASMHCGAIIGGIVNNTLRPLVPSWCDPAWRSLMERCWSGDPANRPSFSEVASELRAIAASMNLK